MVWQKENESKKTAFNEISKWSGYACLESHHFRSCFVNGHENNILQSVRNKVHSSSKYFIITPIKNKNVDIRNVSCILFVWFWRGRTVTANKAT